MSEWISVEERLPEPMRNVLVRQKTGYGNSSTTVVGKRIPSKTEEADIDNTDWFEYDEDSDTYYTPGGWYEHQQNWGEYAAIHIPEGLVTHWCELPEPPK